ncbi:hypothetical protein M758_11G146900 [Ceratodon purpureus]|uniref:Uncharacterized protein n=1 Tax=Ceratodon purpureus TaxID=3225 RepID=A0A8T0GEN0_CERPU|nr:hypothetical protein KC19_11G151400 [Ceratodon purpureus]KAG0601903.1 hypothetical protein M758_11G146900 [Ceratodon purpureus]
MVLSPQSVQVECQKKWSPVHNSYLPLYQQPRQASPKHKKIHWHVPIVINPWQKSCPSASWIVAENVLLDYVIDSSQFPHHLLCIPTSDHLTILVVAINLNSL